MSSLNILILCILFTIQLIETTNIYFTQSNYEIWCQENILSNSLLLYPNRIRAGIYHTSNIKSVTYSLIDNNDDNNNNGLFSIKTKRLADFYFFILNITRPFDINREYQDVYVLRIQANIVTSEGNRIEQAKVHLHVADSNDNDAVFDMDIYEQTLTDPIDLQHPLISFHASDADEIQHAQILYELSSTFNDTFSLHPYTGELYMISTNDKLQSIYEFDIYAYNRQRKYFIDDNIKTKAHVKLLFPEREISYKVKTRSNDIIEFKQMISIYEIRIRRNSYWNFLNIHQPILSIEMLPKRKFYEIFLLHNSSSNSIDLFLHENKIYLNKLSYETYDLQFLICFHNRTQCQYTSYYLNHSIDWNLFNFHFKTIQPISIEENLPINSFITYFQLQYNPIISYEQLIINYTLLDNRIHFNLHPKTGILRLGKYIKSQKYILTIQADIYLFNKTYSIKTNIEINVYEINKYRPRFYNQTLRELYRLPYQFKAFDFDENEQTNARITYSLGYCSNNCPFEINPFNGMLNLKSQESFIKEQIYYLQIIAFDWGEPISFETKIDVRIDLLSKIVKRSIENLSTNQSLMMKSDEKHSSIPSLNEKTVHLNIGFKQNSISYHLSEDSEINTIIDHIKIDYDNFPLFINHEKENLFFYVINDTSVPFNIDQDDKTLRLIMPLDREKQDQYNFEIELKLKPSYVIKLQEIYHFQDEISLFHIQYSTNYVQKLSITIHIDDVNDNIPTCNYFHQQIHLYENQLQTNIFHVHAIDPDLGENGTILYSLLDYNDYFTINPHTGQIDCIQRVDREQIPFFELHIIASDQGQQLQLQSICMTLHIIIIDVNDNIPQFSLTNYTYQLYFDLPRDTIFGQIYATDLDLTNTLIYSIDANPYIKINQQTGHLRLKNNLYHFTDQIINITAHVFDGLHLSYTIIYIHVIRFTEIQEPILLREPAYDIKINRSLPIGTVITNVYHDLQLLESTIDFIDIIHDQNTIPFAIDQQGSIRLIQSLNDLLNMSYWLSIRLTRYRAHPPHSFIQLHITIQEENFYTPQCVNIYQSVKIYDYSMPISTIARVQALSFYEKIQLKYSIISDNAEDNVFSIDDQNGSIQLNLNNQLSSLSNYLLTIRAYDNQHDLSVDCYLDVNIIRRNQLTPRFLHSSVYSIDLIESSLNIQRLRQRLFQVIALLDHKVYDKNIEVRYQITDSNQYFIINRQTGYIASKQVLIPNRTYEFTVEAFTVAQRDDIEQDDNAITDYSSRTKWRIVSSRILLPIKIHVLPMINTDPRLLLTHDSTIHIDVLTTAKVGTILLELKKHNLHAEWFIMTSHVDHTRYFHVNFRSGDFILVRPIDELINETSTRIEININVTQNWIHMNTIKVIIHIVKDKSSLVSFAQSDNYIMVSKYIPIGTNVTQLTVENPSDNCTYKIHSVERIKSKNLFHIVPYSGLITNIQLLIHSLNRKHSLIITYHCEKLSRFASTRLHINLFDEEKLKNQTKNSYRFSQENYLIIFQTTLIHNQPKHLIDLELISNDHYGERKKPDAQIIEGDPLGLFSIDTSNQSVILLDESRSRSYIYPIELVIIDTSQIKPVYCIVSVFISNIGIQFTCPMNVINSPYLFTYSSIPINSIDPLTGQQYDQYESISIYGFDSFITSPFAKCVIENEIKQSHETIGFGFEQEIYHGYVNNSFDSKSTVYSNEEPIHLSIKNREEYINSFNITYEFINQSSIKSFELDSYAGVIKYIQKKTSFIKYSFLTLARYQSLIAFTRLNILINDYKQISYKFILYKPFVNNYTIGYINEMNPNLRISNKKISSMFSIDYNGRIYVKNQTLILIHGNLYNFLIGKIRIQINVLSKEIIHCSLNRLIVSNEDRLIGFIEISNSNKNYSKKRSFDLLNYNHLFILHHQYGLLRYGDHNQTIIDDLTLLIEVENSRCLVTFNGFSSIPYMMIRKGNSLDLEIEKLTNMKKPYGQIQLRSGVLINYDIISSKAPIFSQKLYSFTLDIANNTNKTVFVGQVSAQPYNINRSRLVYEFISPLKYFIINPDNGIIEYITNNHENHPLVEEHQIIARDLIYHQNTMINITIQRLKREIISFIYHLKISEVFPLGSVIFQPNISSNENLHYSLKDHSSDLFLIDSNTGQVTLVNYLSNQYYSFKIHIHPLNQILVIKLTVLDYNNHRPKFLYLPLNLTISSNDVFVTKISGYDLDLPDNDRLKYYLIDKDQQNYFSIDEKTGIIRQINSPNQTFFLLKVAISDGLYLTTDSISLTINNYSKNLPKFSSDDYVFEYNKILGQIIAYDADLNDRIIYKLYLEPDGVKIDPFSGLITMEKDFIPQTIVFFASATDSAQQIVYTKIQILFPIQPKFSSNLYFISVNPPIRIPSEIFHLELVDSLNQPLSSTKFKIDQSNLIEINQNKLILKRQLIPSKIYYFNIFGYWKNFTCQTSIQVKHSEKYLKFNKKIYEFVIEKTTLTENYFIEKFELRKNFTLIINSTPLTRNYCIDNFYIHQNKLFFKHFPIISDLCFFEIQFIHENTILSSQIKISFINSNIKPKFSSKIYHFYTKNIRVFASNFNPIHYKLQANPYGLIIDHTNGIVSFKYDSDKLKSINHIQLFVYAIDDKTRFNDTATIHIVLNHKKQFNIPSEVFSCMNKPISISDQTLPGTIIQNVNPNNNKSNQYYILSGDKYGLFSINNQGELYLFSSILNRTSEEYFDLIILTLSSSEIYCRMNVQILRSPNWSYFICPFMPIEWTIEEESPIGTTIGNIIETLLLLNNNSQLIERIKMKLSNEPDAQYFHFNTSTGALTSKLRLDYERKTFYSLLIQLEPNQLHCSFSILIKLININDNPIKFDPTSLVYNVDENNLIPLYIGRIKLIDIDLLSSYRYQFYFKTISSQISIDTTTGSIILHAKLDREMHGEKLNYDIIAVDAINRVNLTDTLIIHINDLNDHGPVFEQDFYQISINKSTQPGHSILQIMAFSYDPVVNGNITYSLVDSSSMFSVDKYTGDIRLNEYIPSTITNTTLIIEAIENDINMTDRTRVSISIINDDDTYFTIENRYRCVIDENQPIGKHICTIGKNVKGFIYYLIDPMNVFDILLNNGTIINRKVFDYENDPHEYNVTVTVHNRKQQSMLISSMNITIKIFNLNDNPPEFLAENFTRLLYLYYPSINSIIHRINFIDKDQSNLTFEIVNDLFSAYTLQTPTNSIELLLIKPIISNRQDTLIIRIWDDKIFYVDLNLTVVYLHYDIEFPKVISQTIHGYINFEENFLPINLGQLFIENQSQYGSIYFNLIANKNFFIKQISNNQTELYFKPLDQTSSNKYQIHLAAMALLNPIPDMILYNSTEIFFPPTIQYQIINIHLWPIHREMLDRTVSLTINIPENITYEQFIMHNLSSIRQNLAQIIDVTIDYVHIYTYELNKNHIELLVAVLHTTSKRFIHKKILYNMLKNSTNIFEKVLLNQCEKSSCENNAHCTSYISLLYNQYEYFYMNKSQYLIPKYKWNTKCLCTNSYYGERCELKHDKQSPCSSNPCSLMERCIEESSTLYSCQCIDELCNDNQILKENSLECININSPTCRDSSNTLTFDGQSLIRMNLTRNRSRHVEIAFSFRTQSIDGELVKFLYFNETTNVTESIILRIINGYINVECNKTNLLQLNQLLINDGLWHDVYFSIDYVYYSSYYLIRLDHVFSDKIQLSEPIHLKNLHQLLIGSNFEGCLGNLTLNNQQIFFQQENHSIELLGTKIGCTLTYIVPKYETSDDFCSLYHPCYHGGICINRELSFTCNCSKPRFTGDQCQYDLYPCETNPCQHHEQCIPLLSSNSNQLFTCVISIVPLSITIKRYLFIGIITPFVICILLVFIVCCCCKKRKGYLMKKKPSVSAPLLVHKRLSLKDQVNSPMQTLLRVNYNGTQTLETMKYADEKNKNLIMNYLNNRTNQQTYELLKRRSCDSKSYSNSDQMTVPSDEPLINDYDNTLMPQAQELFDLSLSPTNYFYTQVNYPLHLNSLSNLTENFVAENDVDGTESSDVSANNERILLQPSMTHYNHQQLCLVDHNNICTSTSSLPKSAIYARIVKTPKLTAADLNSFENHDADLENNRRNSRRLSAVFQTDV